MQKHTQLQEKELILLVLGSKFMTFGDRLKLWRQKAGYTQHELAEAAGVNISYISNLERNFSPTAKGGKPQPSLRLVDRLSLILKVDQSEMRLAAGYAPTDRQEMIPEDIKVLFHGAEKWSDRKWKAVADALKKDIDFINSIIPDEE